MASKECPHSVLGGLHVWRITALISQDGKRYGLMECHNCGELMVSPGVPIHPGMGPDWNQQ